MTPSTMPGRYTTPALCLVATMLVLAGCVGIPNSPTPEHEATPAAGYGRAFGRVQYLIEGKETAWRASIFDNRFLTLFVQSADTGELQMKNIENDGTFYWPLKAGEYVLGGYEYVRQAGATSTAWAPLGTSFSVPEAGQAVYVGDIRIETGARGYRVQVLDRYSEVLPLAQARLTTGGFKAVKGMMRPERQTGSFKKAIDICDVVWQMQCDDKHGGVRPVSPEGTVYGSPLVQSLTPLLEWKRAARNDITYDVAIYESLLLNTRRLRGRLVDYSEGLVEPRYTPAKPLKPVTHYEWTVRLRNGDTVSSWSRTHHSFYAVIAASWGSQGFHFTTP